MEAKTCPGCNQTKPFTEFNLKNRLKGIRHARCRTCTREQVQRHYEAHRTYYTEKVRKRKQVVIKDHHKQVMTYLAMHPCVDCGEADMVCLEFDHVQGEKVADIGRMLGNYAWDVITNEIAKCEVRCANCHRRKTARQRGWYRNAMDFWTMRP